MHMTQSHLYHHSRFYVAIAVGLFVYGAFRMAGGPEPLAASGDAFFLVYLAGALGFLARHTSADLKRRAARQDEGVLIVVAITLVVIAVNLTGVFLALNGGGKLDAVSLAIVLAAAPLGWLVLHTIAAFHYANLFYFDPPGDEPAGTALVFPGTTSPDLWDFLYFALVIGMTAQVSDVQILTGGMRRAVTGHALVSFFYNTVLIALIVNVAVSH